MAQIFARLSFPAVLSFLLLFPFLLLETARRGPHQETFPYSLFAVLWLLQLAFLLLLRPAVQHARTGALRANPAPLLICLACLILIVLLWAGMKAGEWPAFLGALGG